MTFQQFADAGLDCSECPIHKAEYCGYATCRELSSDPPCSFSDPDQEMDDWIKEKEEQIAKIEERERKLMWDRINAHCKKEIETIKKCEDALLRARSDIDVNIGLRQQAARDYGFRIDKEDFEEDPLLVEQYNAAVFALLEAKLVYRNKRDAYCHHMGMRLRPLY